MDTSKLAQTIRTSLQEPKADEFVKSVEQAPFLKEILENLERCDFESIINQLVSRNLWTDGVDVVKFFKSKNGYIYTAGVNLSKFTSDDKIVVPLDISKFEQLITVLAAKKIEKNPENEAKIKELYLKMMDYIANHCPGA